MSVTMAASIWTHPNVGKEDSEWCYRLNLCLKWKSKAKTDIMERWRLVTQDKVILWMSRPTLYLHFKHPSEDIIQEVPKVREEKVIWLQFQIDSLLWSRVWIGLGCMSLITAYVQFENTQKWRSSKQLFNNFCSLLPNFVWLILIGWSMTIMLFLFMIQDC